jgi:peptide/nickel transport system substrate-binding protein
MENRFGVKDLFLFLMIAGLIVLVLLGIKQYDRQWDVIQETRDKLREQTTDLNRIRTMLERRSFAAVPSPAADSSATGRSTTGPASTGPARPVADARVIRIHQAQDYAEGDTIADLFFTPPDKLTPLISNDQYSQWVQSYVLDPLLDRDPDTFEWLPRLATDWTVSEDGLTIDFTLRTDAVFSNGDPLTADDVVFTMDLTMNEQVEAPAIRSYFDKLSKCVKIGDHGVRFVFKEPYYRSFETAASTQVLSKKFYSKYTPKQLNESTGLLLGSGPYRLPDPTSWKPEPGKPLELVRNERYWGEPSGPNRLVWKVIEQASSRVTEFRNGGLDAFTRPTPEQYDDMKADPEFGPRIQQFAMDVVTSGYLYIGWNEKEGDKPSRFADARVRRAMTMLVDRDAVVRDILHGYATVCNGPFHHLSPQADPSIKPWPYDPAAAVKLLTETGHVKRDGRLFGPDGKEFRFKLLVASGGEVSKRIAAYTKDSLARAGITVDVVPTEFSTMLAKQKERSYDAMLMGWGGVIEDDPHQTLHSDAITGVGDNFIQYSNPKADAAIDRARRTVKDELRMPIWHEVHRIIHDDEPYTFLCNDWELFAADRRIKGVMATKSAANQKTEWYVPAKLQKRQ